MLCRSTYKGCAVEVSDSKSVCKGPANASGPRGSPLAGEQFARLLDALGAFKVDNSKKSACFKPFNQLNF